MQRTPSVCVCVCVVSGDSSCHVLLNKQVVGQHLLIDARCWCRGKHTPQFGGCGTCRASLYQSLLGPHSTADPLNFDPSGARCLLFGRSQSSRLTKSDVVLIVTLQLSLRFTECLCCYKSTPQLFSANVTLCYINILSGYKENRF